MKYPLNISMVMALAVTACAQLPTPLGGQLPLAGEQQRYESDQQACEQQVRRSPSNYTPNDIARVRQCLLDKGHRLYH